MTNVSGVLQLEMYALEEAAFSCVRVGQLGESPQVYQPLANKLQQIVEWLRGRAKSGLEQQGRDRFEGVWSGTQARALSNPRCTTSSHYCLF